MTVLFPQLKYLACLKKPHVNRQISLLTFRLAQLPFVVALCSSVGTASRFNSPNGTEKRKMGVRETIPGKSHHAKYPDKQRSAMPTFPALHVEEQRNPNFDAWKEQPVQSNRHF